jgi:4-hydroxy-4-methyl-2-oxoglutarate aldolase
MVDAGADAHALQKLGAATLGEVGARRMHPRVKPAWPGARVAAPAYPARCSAGDNLGIHVAVALAPAGSVIVAEMGGAREFGDWGEVLPTGAEARGIVGLVIDGCVRDCDALVAHLFPVFSTGLALTGATKERPGSVTRSVTVGDVTVELGDWIVGDVDGVVVVPGAALGDVLAAGQARADKEQALFAALRDGATTVEQLGLDPGLIDGA